MSLVGNNGAEGVPKEKDALGYLRKVQQKFVDQPLIYNKFLEIMKDFKSNSVKIEGVIERVKTLFKGNTNLILGFNQFLPPGHKIDMEEKLAVQYVVKIKHRFREQPAIYQEFLDILQDYQAKRTVGEVYARVQRLFVDEPDLLDEFKYFLPETTNIARPKKKMKRAPKRGGRGRNKGGKNHQQMPAHGAAGDVNFPPGTEQERMFFERLKYHVSKDTWTDFLAVLDLFTRKIITRPELVLMVGEILPRTDYLDRFKSAIQYDDWEERRFQPSRNHYYSFIQSADLNTCTTITPSYKKIPPGVVLPPCSNTDDMLDQNLNFTAISITAGNEEFAFKATRKNIYEEGLFKTEDERFELDMLIENNTATINALQPAADRLKELSHEEAKRVNVKNIDILQVRAIAKLYGSAAMEIVYHLKHNAATALPVVLVRLKQKDKEWRKVKASMRQHWRKLGEANYARSLDHRSISFKQDDKKRRTLKVLLAELTDMTDNVFAVIRTQELRNNEMNNLSLAAMLQESEPPVYEYAMVFSTANQKTHLLCYEVIKRMAGRIVNKEAAGKLEKFLELFLFRFLNVKFTPAQLSRKGHKLSSLLDEDEEQAEDDDVDMAAVADTTAAVAVTAAATTEGKTAAAEDQPDAAQDDATAVEEDVADAKGNDRTTRSIAKTNFSATGGDVDITQQLQDIFSALEKPIKTQFKPVSMQLDAFDECSPPLRGHTQPSKLMFANGQFYVLFRLYRFLYNRMDSIEELCQGEPAMKSKKLPSAPQAKHVYYMDLLDQLLSGAKEAGRYEDAVRSLLGSDAFRLFSIEKLIGAFVKAVLKTLMTPASLNVMQLFVSEDSRAQIARTHNNTTVKSKALAMEYYDAAATDMTQADVIGDRETCLIQIEHFHEERKLCFAVRHVKIKPSSGPKFGEFHETNPVWAKHVAALVSGNDTAIATALLDLNCAPFLNRNVRQSHEVLGASINLNSTELLVVNNLAFYLGPAREANVRFWYEPDTEDCFARLNPAEAKTTAMDTSEDNTNENNNPKAQKLEQLFTRKSAKWSGIHERILSKMHKPRGRRS